MLVFLLPWIVLWSRHWILQ